MANAQVNLLGAIVDKLRADTGVDSLTDLTNHVDSNPREYRIGRTLHKAKAKFPFLAVSVFQSVPLIDDGPSFIQEARIHFRCYSTEELTALKIGDRMEDLLHARSVSPSETNRGYLDFSNADISNRQTRWKSRDLPDFDDDNDVYVVLVEADIIWLDEPCPSP